MPTRTSFVDAHGNRVWKCPHCHHLLLVVGSHITQEIARQASKHLQACTRKDQQA